MQEWAKFIKSRTARHKLAKYLKDNWELLPEQLRKADQITGSTSRTESSEGGQPNSSAIAGLTEKVVRLDLNGADRPSLLADVAQIMGKHGHHVRVCLTPPPPPPSCRARLLLSSLLKALILADSLAIGGHRDFSKQGIESAETRLHMPLHLGTFGPKTLTRSCLFRG